MSEPAFADPIWGVRLQVLWICFTVFYSAAGHYDPERVISSWMILVAGILLLAVFAHIIVSSDLERVRRMLLVVLAASLFVVNLAVQTFQDYLAAAFASLFAFMLAILLWRSRRDAAFKYLEYSCFTSMSLAVVGGVFGLLATISLKQLIVMKYLSSGLYVYAPMQTATMCGFSVGTLLGGRILSNRTAGYIRVPPLAPWTLFLRTCLLCGTSGVIIAIANRARVAHWIGGLARGSLFAVCYSACFIVPSALYLTRVHRSCKVSPLVSLRTSLFLVLLGLGASLPASILVSRATRSGAYAYRWTVVEGPTGVVIGISVAVGFVCVNRLTNTIMAVPTRGAAHGPSGP
jgi:hypothetical protein